MSLTLGEKLRQAREERGISISEVAEQTRISPHYIESIENDNYKTLPGGIFNKGFIKSFAKYVGVDEQEALQDYSRAIVGPDGESSDEPRTYRPEVLTDDRSSSSNTPTIIIAVVILGLMTAGVLFLVNYLRGGDSEAGTTANTAAAANANASNQAVVVATPTPVTDRINVVLKAVGEPVWTSYAVDGKPRVQTLNADEAVTVDAKESFRLSYSKAKLPNLQISVNGKQIEPPAASAKGNIELTINKANIAEIMQAPAASPTAEQPAAQQPAAPAQPTAVTRTPERARPTPRAAATATPNSAPTPIVAGRPAATATP